MRENIYPSKISERLRVLAALFAAGMLSAILTVSCVAWTGLDLLNPFVGAIFGAVVAICLSLLLWRWFFVGRIIALTCASVVAYCAAVWLPAWGTVLLRWLRIFHGNARLHETSPGTFSCAGFVGAFIVLLAVLLLFSQETGWRIPAKAFFLSLAGAVLGLISATASNTVAGFTQAGLTRLGVHADANLFPAEHFYSAYLVWQTGMGLVIAVALLAPPAGTRPVLPLRATPFPARLTVWGKAFASFVIAATAVMAVLGGYGIYRSRNSQRQSEKAWRQSPSAENLPRIVPKPVEQVLILHEIAGYAPAEPQMKVEPARHEFRSSHQSNPGQPSRVISRTFAPTVTYHVQYRRTSAMAPQPWVRATIWEFPNSEWANYELKDVPVTDAKTLSPSSIRSATRLGKPVLTYTLKGVSGLYVFWTSTNKVVILHFSAREEDEFIRQYLAQYPSSLFFAVKPGD